MPRYLLPLLALAASGCVDTASKYPSLLPRPIESQGTAEPVRPAPVPMPDATLDARVATVNATLDKAQRDFSSAAQETEAKIAVARGLPEGSEPWIDAQSSLALLSSLLAPVSDTLGELERVAMDRAQVGQPPYPALDAVIVRASRLSDDQAARLRMLEASLASR